MKEGDATVLDNSMILFGSALSDGNTHDPHRLPLVLGGRGGGRHRVRPAPGYAEDTPLANLYVRCSTPSARRSSGSPTARVRCLACSRRATPQASGLRPIAVFGSTMPFFYRLVASILVLIGTPVLISHPMGNLSISRYARLDLHRAKSR